MVQWLDQDFQQLFPIFQFARPIVTGPLVVQADPLTCAATVNVPFPSFNPEGCETQQGLRYIFQGQVTELNQPYPNSIPLEGLEKGNYTLTWQVFNVNDGLTITSADQLITVEQAPIVCPEDVVIDLDPGLCEKVVTYTLLGEDCLDSFVEGTVFSSNPFPPTTFLNAFAGVTFDIQNVGTSTLTIQNFTSAFDPGTHDVSVWYTTTATTNVGNQVNPAAWTLLGSTSVTSVGPADFANQALINVGGLVLEAGESKGIYIVVNSQATTGNIRYTNVPPVTDNSDDNLRIIGNGFAGGVNFNNIFAGRVFVGSVTYEAGTNAELVLLEGLPSGGSFPIGCTTNTWALIDNEGNELSSCSFEVCVNEYSGPVNPNLSCNNLINVSLGFVNGECRTVLGADDILEGGPYRCYENYIVQITYPQIPGINSYAEGNILDYSHVGLTLTVMVTDPVTGNRCWGQIRVEDKQAPLLDCGDELTFPCTSGYAENRDPRGNRIVFPSGLFWGSPANSPIRVTPQLFLNDAINNRRFLVEAGVIDCSQVVLTYSDQEIILGCNDEDGIWRRVIRTWVATDAYHNTSSCEQILNFERLSLEEAIAESGVTAGILNLQPCTPGFALPDYNLQGACNVWVGIKSELQMPLCGNSEHSYKLFRTYKFFDDCTGQSQDVEQIIVVKDEIAPVFTACQNGLLPQRTLNTNTFSCKADVVLTLPAVTDNCSSALTVVPSVAGAQLLNIGGTWTATFDVGGPYQMTWTATDECGNQSQCFEWIYVEDKRPPVAVCISNTTVALTEGGEARVYATSIDNGSWDNCGIFDYKVMRMSNTTRSFCGQSHNTSENPALGSTFNPAQPNAPYWRDFVSFCCADLEATEPVEIVLRVRDIYGNVNYCMVNVEVQTKIPPVITAPAAVTIECRDFQSELEFQADLLNRERSLAKGYGWATVSSICNEEPRVSVSINLTECGITQFPGNRVVRRFTVGTGVNTRTADQEFFVVNSTPFRILSTPTIHNSIDDVVWPIDLEFPCNDAFDVEALKERYNETTKTFFDFSEPALATRPRSMPFLRPVACSTPGMGHEDHVFEFEGGCLKIIREWKVIDWCQPGTLENPWTYTQLIKVADFNAPIFTACQNGFLPERTLNTNTFSCKADVTLTLPAVTDNCSSTLTVVPSVAGTQLLNIGGTWTATFDAGGPYQVTWTATDECGNQSQCFEWIYVEDKRPPVAVCITNTTVALTEGGETKVYATSLDNGSWDNCGIKDYKVMRMSNTTRSFCGQSHNTSENPALGSTFNPAQPNAPYWRDFVSFCCADLEATEPIMVVLRVRDIYGNVNYCMVSVEVQTKIPPVITAPAAVTIECRDFQSELEFQADLLNRERSLAKGYGWATVSSVCNEEPRISVSINLTDCGVTQFPGNRVVRRFTVGTGSNTRTADQEFFVVNSTPFRILSTPTIHNSIDDVVWPIDLELPTCNDAFDVEALKERYNETTKTFFDFSEPALATRPRSMPFLRPFKCAFPRIDHEDHVFELEGGCLQILREWKVIDLCQPGTLENPWTYTQVIKVMDSAPAEFVSVSINLASGQFETVEGCPTSLISLAHTADNCAPGLSFSLVTSDDCTQLHKIAYSYRLIVGKNVNSFEPTTIEETGNGLATAEGVIEWNFGAFAPQFQGVVHRIIWTLDDKCGNISTCQFDFIIKDGKKPSPICTDEIIALLMPSSGEIVVSASLFNVASFDNCGGDLKYTFGAPFGNPGALEARVFDCDDYADNFDDSTGTSEVTLPIFVTDAAGNSDFCTVTLALLDNDEVCGDISSVIVRGTLATEHATGINSADVTTVVGNQANITVTSDFEGEYNLRTDRAQGSTDYVVSPEKTDHVLNGVTTLDILLMQQHILGERPLNSPYARIAADVNADGRINSLDIVELRQVLLLKKDGFSGSNAGLSWKFVDANYVFTTSTPEGENYATTVTIDGSKNNYGVDFVGVKLGDVNGSADAKSLGITEDRSGRALMGLEVADVELTAGMKYAIAFRSSEMSDVMGYQYALVYGRGLEVKGIEGMGQVVSANNYGIFADKNLVTMSWNGQTTGEDLFVVHVKANETVKLSNALSLSMNPAHPVAEAYTVGGEVKGLELRFKGVSTSVLGYALNQNEPNPFKTETKISFQLPSEMRAKVSISDVSGRVLRTYEGVYPAGLNELFVKRSEVGAAGVLYYTLETEDYRATKKMIPID
jgi:hypothetical protein